MQRIDYSKMELEERLIKYNSVTKVVKGGKNNRWSAIVVVGDNNGHVGVGSGKAIEIPEAHRKATEAAKKNLMFVPRKGTTVPHRIIGEFGSGRVLIMPAKEGTGVIAGGVIRAVLELAGIKDVRAKNLGTNNVGNVLNATLDALSKLKDGETIAKLRGKSIEEILE